MPNYKESAQIREAFLQARWVVIALDAHVDLDALASSLALSHILEIMGTDHTIVCANQIPKPYFRLSGTDKVFISASFAELKQRPLHPDLIVIPDLGTLDQLGELYNNNKEHFANIPIVQIDHHFQSTICPSLSIIDRAAAATSEQMTLIFQDLKIPITESISTALFSGIISDTRSFSTPTVAPRTLRVAAYLVEVGANVVSASHISRSLSYPQLKLWGLSLAELGIVCDGKVGLATVTRTMLEKSECRLKDTSGLVNLMDDASGSMASVLLKELPNGDVRASFRSPGVLPVLEIATEFGGGGHTYAAACTLRNMSLDEAKATITRKLYDLIQRSDHASK